MTPLRLDLTEVHGTKLVEDDRIIYWTRVQIPPPPQLQNDGSVTEARRYTTQLTVYTGVKKLISAYPLKTVLQNVLGRKPSGGDGKNQILPSLFKGK